MSTAYISEASYAGSPPTDFLEVAVLAGTDTSAWKLELYNVGGDYLYTQAFPALTATEVGKDIYVFGLNLNASTSIAIVDDTGTTLQFLSFYDPPVTSTSGPLTGQTPTYAGTTAASGQSIQSDDGGATYYTQSTPNQGTIPCFAPGMMVACPGGPRAVETLAIGDPVLTRDDGAQPIVWTSARRQVFDRPDFSDRPILIRAGRFGAGSDLIVSPQHRILLDGPGRQVLAPAKALCGLRGIRMMRGRGAMDWHHFATRRHSVVRVNGVWTESLLLGPMVLGRLPRADLVRLRGLFDCPPHGAALNGPAARPCLSVRQTAELLSRLPHGCDRAA